MVAFSND